MKVVNIFKGTVHEVVDVWRDGDSAQFLIYTSGGWRWVEAYEYIPA